MTTQGPQDDDMLPEERALLEAQAAGEKATPATVLAEDDKTAQPDQAAEPAQPVATQEAQPETPAAPILDEDGDPVLIPVAVKDFKAQFEALDARQAEIESKWAAGEIDDEARLAALKEIRAQDRALTKEEARQETMVAHNEAAVSAAQQQMLGKLMAASKAAGEIDYANAAAQAAYNAQLQHLLSTEFKDKDMRDWANVRAVYTKTHADLCAAFGVKKQAAAPAPAPTAAKAEKPVIPPTLGGIPAAGAVPVTNEFLGALSGLDDPDAAEALVAAQPKATRESILRSASPTGRRH